MRTIEVQYRRFSASLYPNFPDFIDTASAYKRPSLGFSSSLIDKTFRSLGSDSIEAQNFLLQLQCKKNGINHNSLKYNDRILRNNQKPEICKMIDSWNLTINSVARKILKRTQRKKCEFYYSIDFENIHSKIALDRAQGLVRNFIKKGYVFDYFIVETPLRIVHYSTSMPFKDDSD